MPHADFLISSENMLLSSALEERTPTLQVELMGERREVKS